jgi:hypothetical protein
MTPQEQQQLNRLLQEGIELAKKLGDTASEASFRNFNGDLRTAQLAVKSLSDEWKEYINDISGAREGFTRIVDEIKNMNSGAKIAKSSFSGLASVASKLQSHQENITSLTSKEIQSLKSKSGDRFNDLLLAGKLAKEEVQRLQTASRNRDLTRIERRQLLEAKAAHENITNEITRSASFIKQLNSQLDDQLEKQIQIEKTLGLSGALMKGMSKIPFLGDLPGMSNVLKDVEDEIKQINKQREEEGKAPVSRAEALKMTFGKMKGVIKDSLTDPMAVAGFLIDQIVDALIKGDTATGDLAKEFNITYNEAANLREELIQMGNSSLNIALNARALQESMVAVGKSLGSNAMLNKEDLETFTELREMAGYTNEELIGMQKLTLATGGNLKDNTKQFLGTVSALNAQNKLTVNEKQLLKEVSNTSAAIKLSVGGTTKGLAEAAFKAKEFGINLDQADHIAESLLDFESSITNELSAELITGKDLNLEKARLLALNGDIAGASAEILKQVKGSAEFTKMNRIQQEALAKAVGMSREDLAASLIEREALQKIGVKDAAAAKAKFDLLVKEKGYAAAVAEMGDEQYATQLKQQSIQERFNQSVEKLKEIFISISEPILRIISPLMDLVTTVLPAINILLTPIVFLFKFMADAVQGFTDLIHGDLKSGLGGVLQIAQSIAVVWGAIVLGAQLLGKETLANISLQGTLQSLLSADFWKRIGSAIASIFTGESILGPFGIPVAIAASAGMVGLATSYFNKGDDVTSMGGYGKRVLLHPEGAVALNNNDTVIAGTNLGGKRRTESTSQQNVDISPLVTEMKAMRQEQARSNSKPTIVENSVNGTRFGTAVAMNTYKVQ